MQTNRLLLNWSNFTTHYCIIHIFYHFQVLHFRIYEAAAPIHPKQLTVISRKNRHAFSPDTFSTQGVHDDTGGLEICGKIPEITPRPPSLSWPTGMIDCNWTQKRTHQAFLLGEFFFLRRIRTIDLPGIKGNSIQTTDKITMPSHLTPDITGKHTWARTAAPAHT